SLACPMVTRVMPNTPALIGEGVSLVYHLPAVQAEQKDQVGQYFSACSSVQLLEDEKSFDLVTTVTGSGPAYVYFFAKTMEDALKAWGVEAKSARIMVTQLFKGSALLMEENAQTPLSDLLGAVTSKGGVTIEAI